MSKRHALTDEQWTVVEPLIPKPKKRKTGSGRPPKDPRLMLDGIFWILATGAPWRDLPERFGMWNTVYDHFWKWRRAGIFAAIIEALQVKLDDKGLIDWELWCVDGAVVRASRAAAVSLTGKDIPHAGGDIPTTRSSLSVPADIVLAGAFLQSVGVASERQDMSVVQWACGQSCGDVRRQRPQVGLGPQGLPHPPPRRQRIHLASCRRRPVLSGVPWTWRLATV